MVVVLLGLMAVPILLLGSFIFFITGGCVTLYRTVTNGQLPAKKKLFWMLGQIYFPPTSIAYLALVEKSRKFQIIGAIGILIASYLPLHFIAKTDWSHLPQKTSSFMQKFETGFDTVKERDTEKKMRRLEHKQEDALDKKHEELKARLDEIKNKPDAATAKIANTLKMLLTITTMQYASGDISEDDYAALLDKLDTITATGTLSPQDAKEWVDQMGAITKKNKHQPSHP